MNTPKIHDLTAALEEVASHKSAVAPLQVHRYDVGINVKELRESFGMSHVEFSERFNIPVSVIEEWESGRQPSSEALMLLKIIQSKPEAITGVKHER